MVSLLFASYTGGKQIDAKNLCIHMVHPFSRWASEAQKAGLHLSETPTEPYLENVFRAKLVYKDNTEFGTIHKDSSPNHFKAPQRKRKKQQRTGLSGPLMTASLL